MWLMSTNFAVGQGDIPSQSLADIVGQLKPDHFENSCPCGFPRMATWAGWEGPECLVKIQPLGAIEIAVNSRGDYLPGASILFFPFTGVSGLGSCYATNDNFVQESFDISGEEQFKSCLSSLDRLARDLGRFDGCKLED
jgi:hypothetical protein